MNAEQVKYALNKYSLDTLLQIQLNNSKKVWISSKEERDALIWNDSIGVLEFKQNLLNGVKADYVVPYDVIEGLIFKDDMTQSSFQMDTNKLRTDENGKLVAQW